MACLQNVKIELSLRLLHGNVPSVAWFANGNSLDMYRCKFCVDDRLMKTCIWIRSPRKMT